MLARSPSPDHMSTPSRSTRIEHVRPSPQLSLPPHRPVRRVTVTAPSYVPCVVSVVNSESGMASGQLEHTVPAGRGLSREASARLALGRCSDEESSRCVKFTMRIPPPWVASCCSVKSGRDTKPAFPPFYCGDDETTLQGLGPHLGDRRTWTRVPFISNKSLSKTDVTMS